jgi:hypothetical protein
LSDEEFLGRVINSGLESYYFELCDICEKHPPNWIETNKVGNVSEIRVTCNECHSNFLDSLSQSDETVSEEEFEIYDEIPAENEDITPVERPAWMQDFIDEAEKSGAIETIGGTEEAESNIEILGEFDSESSSEDTLPTQANETELSNAVSSEGEEVQPQIAHWSGAFVKEALFGQDPVSWLEQQSAFGEENIDVTIFTLTKLSENQVTNVKITAIHCLNNIINKFSNKKDEIISALKNFTDDIDEMVSNYANETISSIK